MHNLNLNVNVLILSIHFNANRDGSTITIGEDKMAAAQQYGPTTGYVKHIVFTTLIYSSRTGPKNSIVKVEVRRQRIVVL